MTVMQIAAAFVVMPSDAMAHVVLIHDASMFARVVMYVTFEVGVSRLSCPHTHSSWCAPSNAKSQSSAENQ